MQENDPPLPLDRILYAEASLSFQNALHLIVSADHSHLMRRDWKNAPEIEILTTWLEATKKELPQITLKAEVPKFIAGIGVTIDAASVGAAYSIQMGQPDIMNFCRQADAFIGSHGGPGWLQLIDVFAKAPHLFNAFPMTSSSIANAILAFASYSAVLNESLLAGALPGLAYAIDRMIHNKRLRIQSGKETIHQNERVGSVLIGPLSLMDAVAGKTKIMKGKNTLDVMIHTETGTPSSLGNAIERHFGIPTERLNAFSTYIREQIRNWGLKKAKRIVLAAFDENFSLFYGSDATRGLTTSHMTTLLAALAPEKSRENLLEGKRTLLLVPASASIVGASTTTDRAIRVNTDSRVPDYIEKLRASGMLVDVETPESVLYERQLEQIISGAKTQGRKSIVLVGSDGEIEEKMLKRFSAFLIQQDPELETHLIQDTSVDGKKVDIGISSNEAKEIIGKAGAVFIYAESDARTTDATEAVLSLKVIEDGSIPHIVHAIIESPDAFANDPGGHPAHRICVFNELAGFTEGWLDKKIT